MKADDLEKDFHLERYRYILQQLHSTNESVYKLLGIFQALETSLVAGILAIFVGYRKWEIGADQARSGLIGLALLATLVGIFTVVLILACMANWFDYRKEECELAEAVIESDFRKPPMLRNWFRWNETYIILFIVSLLAFLWIAVLTFLIPSIK
jgi:hypothetical protein